MTDTFHIADGDPIGRNDQAVIDTAIASAEPQPLDGTVRFYSQVIPAGGSHVTIDVEDLLDQHRDRPRRKAGTYQVHDADSFIAYVGKHGDPTETEVWADITSARITAVLNSHTHGPNAGWEDHRIQYGVQHTDAWKVWTKHDGELLEQTAFAELIEDRSPDIVNPAAADMLELAQSFQATVGVKFNSSRVLSSGERQLEYTEDVQASAGRNGHLDIPGSFELALVPFEGAARYKVTARFRYRLLNGTLKIGYRLERPADVLREAFNEVVDSIAAGVTGPTFRGSAR